MAYDESVAQRVRAALADRPDVAERTMFGGLAFLVGGHLCCGVLERDLMLRLGEEGAAVALNTRHVRPMDFTGKPMKTMVQAGPAAFRAHADLVRFVDQAVAFVRTLPPR